MTEQRKVWTRLGLGTAAALSALNAGCAPAEDAAPQLVEAQAPAVAAPVPAASGEGEGEGGVAIAQAATDPVVYLSALAITEAHVLAARDAYAAGATDAAGEMFAHPVSEVLAEMQPILEQRGATEFTDLMLAASDAAYSGEPVERIAALTEDIMAAIRAAEAFAPNDGRSDSAIWAGVVADQIDRAADMYGIALDSGTYEPYLDGYGFLAAARDIYALYQAEIESGQPQAASAMRTTLDLLGAAYPGALKPEALDKNPAQLRAAASQVQLELTP